jgi:hypothetical protein
MIAVSSALPPSGERAVRGRLASRSEKNMALRYSATHQTPTVSTNPHCESWRMGTIHG